MGYHKAKITKGSFGEFSKIIEEFEELKDAYEQNNKIMQLIELSDLIGAIEKYASKFNISIHDILKMKESTKEAFESGDRK